MSKALETQSLEIYLAQIAHELRALPPQARADEMREIEAHLRAMIKSRGDVADVLAQFGKPRKVGRDLRRALERKQPESWINGALALVVSCLFAGWHDYFLSWINALYSERNFFIVPFPIYMFWTRVFTSVIAGFLLGFISPKRKWGFVVLTVAVMLALDVFPFYGGSFAVNFVWLKNHFLLRDMCQILLPLITGAHFGARSSRKRTMRIAK